MFRVTLVLFLLCCLLTGYRVVGQQLSPSETLAATVSAQASSLDDPADAEPGEEGNTPVPTVAPLFRVEGVATLIPTATPGAQLVVPETTITASVAEPTPQPQLYPEIMIYDDELDSNWTLEQSTAVSVNPWDTSHWFETLHPQLDLTSGSTAIAVAPQADFGSLYFTVRPESTAVYTRTDILGVSFWLNSGSTTLGPGDLTVTVVGSNQQPTWSADDNSVFPDGSGKFSETRLYFLEVNQMIPANTWINLIVWLNELQYDPVYTYVTGFYIKNDVGFRSTYYIDRVTLITNDAE